MVAVMKFPIGETTPTKEPDLYGARVPGFAFDMVIDQWVRVGLDLDFVRNENGPVATGNRSRSVLSTGG